MGALGFRGIWASDSGFRVKRPAFREEAAENWKRSKALGGFGLATLLLLRQTGASKLRIGWGYTTIMT